VEPAWGSRDRRNAAAQSTEFLRLRLPCRCDLWARHWRRCADKRLPQVPSLAYDDLDKCGTAVKPIFLDEPYLQGNHGLAFVRRSFMNAWACAGLIAFAGGVGGLLNAYFSHNGFVMPMWKRNVWCPGVIGNIIVGIVSAVISWALYGSGEGIDLAQMSARTVISFRLSALAGACLVGIAGARWLTGEVDKRLLTESIKVVGTKNLSRDQCEELVRGSPMDILERAEQA
jgi:hypothetical protein